MSDEATRDTNLLEENNDSIRELGASHIKNARGTIECMSIIGQVEGHTLLPPQNKSTKYEHLLPQLVAIEESDEVDGLLLLLNTIGGDVEAGLAIAELIATMKKPTVSLVLGGGHSIGVPLAVSAKKSFIAQSATMTIHPIRMSGTIIGVPQTYAYFNKMQERVVQFVTRNSRITRQELLALMLNTGEIANDVGTILFGADAVQHRLIDAMGGLQDAVETLYTMIEQRRKTESSPHP